jgi:hypothetical protein
MCTKSTYVKLWIQSSCAYTPQGAHWVLPNYNLHQAACNSICYKVLCPSILSLLPLILHHVYRPPGSDKVVNWLFSVLVCATNVLQIIYYSMFYNTDWIGNHIFMLKITAFWDIAPCSLVEVDRCFRRGTASLIRVSVYFNKTAWCYIPESCHLHTRYHENLNSHYIYFVYRLEQRIWVGSQLLMSIHMPLLTVFVNVRCLSYLVTVTLNLKGKQT